MTYREIREQLEVYNVHISCDDVLCRCFLRTALGFPWELGGSGGRDPYLCREDAKELVQAISDASTSLDCCPTHFVLNFAHELKIDRVTKAFTFLHHLRCDKLANALELEVEPPNRAWLASFAEAHNLRIRSPQTVEAVRRKACDKRRIADWFQRFGGLIEGYDEEMVLNMDETGLATNHKFKVVVPDGVFPVVAGGKTKEVHLTGIVTISATGKVFTPGVILPSLKNLPQELEKFVGDANFYQSRSGWMTRELFELYCLNLAHEVGQWRLGLPPARRNKRVLLIVDGHSSRKSPRAIAYLQQFGIDMLTLPGHSTHVLQPFDVSVAAVLKSYMSRSVERWNRDLEAGVVVAPTAAGTKRLVLVSSFLDALDNIRRGLVRSAFAAAGLVPVNPERPMSSPLVLPDSTFDHPDDWISSTWFGPGSPVMVNLLAGIPHPVTAEGMLRERTDQALTPVHPRVDHAMVTDFAVPQ